MSVYEKAFRECSVYGNSCSLEELKPLIVLIGILHDIGKFGRENQEDFKNILVQGNESHKHGLDHSTAGGRLAQELIKEGSVAEFISTVIYFHLVWGTVLI